MKTIITALLITLGLVLVMPASADTVTNQFGQCMTDALNGKERKMLATWLFISIAAHPDIKAYSKVTQQDIQTTDEYIGKLVTRLLTVDCPEQLLKAKDSNPMALQEAFALVGKAAMQELMSNADVAKSLSGYVQYADQAKITALMSKKK